MASDEQLRTAFRILGRATEEQVPLPPSPVAPDGPAVGGPPRARRLVPLLSAGAVAALTVGVVVLADRPSDGPGEVVVTRPPASAPPTVPVDVTSGPSLGPGPVPTTGAAAASSTRTPVSGGTSAVAGSLTAPTEVKAMADGPQAVVTWSVPVSGAGRVTGYLIEALDAGGKVVDGPRVGPDLRRYVFPSLAAGEYRVRVSVLSSGGTGPGATSGQVSVRTAPQVAPVQAPPVAVGGGRVVVAWYEPAADAMGNSPLTGYRVFAYDAAGSEVKTLDVAAGDQYVIVPLEVGGTYRFRIVAVNAFGGSPLSPFSDPVTVT